MSRTLYKMCATCKKEKNIDEFYELAAKENLKIKPYPGRINNKIKHWQIIKGDYRDIQNIEATWFIYPPYKVQIHGYNCKIENYEMLAEWCKQRNGQIIVCENENGDWLPFQPLKKLNGINKQTTEYIWTNHVVQQSLQF